MGCKLEVPLDLTLFHPTGWAREPAVKRARAALLVLGRTACFPSVRNRFQQEFLARVYDQLLVSLVNASQDL